MAQLKSTTINGNLSVTGNFNFATRSGVGIPAWKWTTICPAGAIPSAFRPNVNRAQYIALQAVGAGSMNFNADGSISIVCYGDFGGPWAGGLQVIYPIN